MDFSGIEQNKKPENITQYLKWLKTDHNIVIDNRYETYYNLVALKIKRDFEQSLFWKELLLQIKSYDEKYLIQSGYPLFNPKFEPELITKPFESFLLKTFRRNILGNKDWPEPPKKGWLFPTNWFTQINDIIRTLFVVKYLDGAGFLEKEIQALCRKFDMGCHSYFEAREEGYYAAHIYTEYKFDIPKIDLNSEEVTFSVELQITTQLQEILRKLLHKYYEERRKAISPAIEKWQWNYQSDEFSANYLGHILHYVEGMIMEIREKQAMKQL